MMKPESPSENNELNKNLIQWGYKQLLSLGYTLKCNRSETVQNTPWSYVARFATSDGDVYLKHTPELLALEAPITQILREKFRASVPTIIAYHPEYHCFLMKDAGQSLRESLKKQFDSTLLANGVDQFTSIQLATTDHIDSFLKLGVPDWRLDHFTALYSRLIEQTPLLQQDGLSEKEMKRLHQLIPICTQLCEHLSSYKIPETLVHCDFHDNNILLDEKRNKVTIIDWGETVIAHPFFSLNSCLWNLTYFYNLKEADSLYKLVEKRCIAAWLDWYSESYLLDALQVNRKIHGAFAALGYEQLHIATKDQLVSVQQEKPGAIAGCLRTFLSANIDA